MQRDVGSIEGQIVLEVEVQGKDIRKEGRGVKPSRVEL
jgi:hypothetical protein